MIRLLFRWQVLKAVLVLLQSVGDAVEDGELSDADVQTVVDAHTP